ncbi:hypothetical protein P7B02_17350 [Caulobacter segnis]|uniref:hypothetical protein n=1 Tax=Caulobacter segnis TaxID=88688 RepID=UPI00240F710E|nr:hypothetical protein [Caulobacter segnis]MDG2523299.1 hypothetical protein [Caulobacter segnis]
MTGRSDRDKRVLASVEAKFNEAMEAFDVLAEAGTITARAPTSINAANLSPQFVADLTAGTDGASIGRCRWP